jgi:hypothetical protein
MSRDRSPPTWILQVLLPGILAAGCAPEPLAPLPPPSPEVESVPMMPIPPKAGELCRSTAGGVLGCPELVPRTETAPRFKAFKPFRDHAVFFAEWSGPYPGIVRRNRPPRFAHLVVQAGDLERGLAFAIPAAGSMQGSGGVVARRRSEAISYGQRSWGGKQGLLVLAPSFPHGGIDGDHLMLIWESNGIDHSVSLHAWLPLVEAEATLRKVVMSTP